MDGGDDVRAARLDGIVRQADFHHIIISMTGWAGGLHVGGVVAAEVPFVED